MIEFKHFVIFQSLESVIMNLIVSQYVKAFLVRSVSDINRCAIHICVYMYKEIVVIGEMCKT